MSANDIYLTEAEWSVMECLWEHSPMTGREITQQMQERMGWTRSTTLTLLRRIEAKGAAVGDAEGGIKSFRPLIGRDDAAIRETENFLGRVYKGSVGMLVSSLAEKNTLSKEDIAELYDILKKAEGADEND